MRRTYVTLHALLLFGALGFLAPEGTCWAWSPLDVLQPAADVGTPEWWKQNKGQARFDPKNGYSVPGVPGYFDQNGNRIDQPVDRRALAEKETGLLPSIDPQVTYQRMKGVVGLGPNEQAAKNLFAAAEQAFAEGDYAKSGTLYGDAAARWPRSQLEEDSLFMIGESHYFKDRYLKSRDAYNLLVEKYPNTRHMNRLVERQWAIAQYWEAEYFDSLRLPLSPNAYDKTRPTFDTVGHAIKTYESIRLNDPTGPRADDAILATAGIHFRRKRYDEADYHYSLLRREYPRSEFQFEAHLLGLQAKLRKYQGPDYDGAALEEARRLATKLQRQFGGRLNAEEKERLRKVRAELNMQIVQRDMRMAKYYDDKKHYRAARQYYQEVARKFPDSPLAEQARLRLAEIVDEPDVPPERLAWFVDLFPESRERTRVARIPELQNQTRVAQTSNARPAAAADAAPASANSTR